MATAAWPGRRSEVAAQPAPAGQRWEYAQFMVTERATVLNWPGGNLSNPAGFALYKDVGGTEDERQYSNVAMLNLLGGEGWELVTSDASPSARTYLLKRPAK